MIGQRSIWGQAKMEFSKVIDEKIKKRNDSMNLLIFMEKILL